METEEKINEQLWREAKKRVGFKWNLFWYLLVNVFLTALWLIEREGFFWPIWCIGGWGVGLIFQYLKAYRKVGLFSADKEYQKLKQQRGN